ncbi:MAG: outer membrane protein assembly factor BamA [Bacteroidetes bacterium]|nr:MAG: outer membrane protein assembly factor BamA [Bacteroidota bacterium]
MKNIIFIYLLLLFPLTLGAQEDSLKGKGTSTEIGGSHYSYKKPVKVELGPIRVEGAENYDHQAIKLISGLRQGDRIRIPGNEITRAVKNLWEEGVFSDVGIYVEKEYQGIVYLVIKLKVRPKLSRFRFKGVTRREADNIRENISLFSGKTITENLVFNTSNAIKGYFREKGYYNVQINIKREVDSLINNSEMFTIDVVKGKKVKIGNIEIEGDSLVPQWKLRMAMKDTKKKAFWRVFKRSKFSVSAYERDKEAMLDKFRAIGLRDVAITYDTVYQVDPRNLHIKIKVEEGSKYYFGKIEWIGNTKFRSTYLDTILGIKYGDVYNKPLLKQRLEMSQDGRDISSLYMDRGYLFFQVKAVEMGVTDHHISYQMRIIEGKEARVGKVIIKGNTKSNEHVVRREIRFKPGDLFNRNDIIRTHRELAQLGFFNDQNIQIVPLPNPQDGTVDIEVTVEEKSSDQIELSGGYGAGRIIGTLGLTFNNFSVQNMFKKYAWTPLPTGDGQRLSIRAQSNGRFYQGYNFSFTEPWMGGKKPNSFTLWMNHTQFSQSGDIRRSQPGYSGVGISGLGVGFGRRKRIPDDYFSARYDFAYQYYDVRNSASIFPGFSDGYSNDISFQYVLLRNSVDNPIYAKEGSKLQLTAKTSLPYSLMDNTSDYSNLTSQERYKYLEYYKIKFTGEWYLPLTMDKKLVLMPRVGFGFMGNYSRNKGLSPFERFYMGGNGLTGINQFGGREIIALRGYEDNSLSSEDGDPLVAKYTLELRYPISLNPQATFFVLAFGEAGNTYPNLSKFNPFNVKKSAGVGVRVFLPMFGMLGLDYGWGFDTLDPHARGYQGTTDQSIRSKGYYGKLNFTIGMNLGEL